MQSQWTLSDQTHKEPRPMTYDRRNLLRLTLAGLLCCATSPLGAQVKPNVKRPRIDGGYVTVYRPAGDRFPGPDTEELKAGQWYESWVPNDHAIIRGPDERWHAIGITHPLTSTKRVHDGEFQSFHAVAPKGLLKDVLRDAVWTDRAKILPAAQRPGEIPENHAPSIVLKDGLYYMYYGPSPIRLATSPDLMTWTPQGVKFSEREGARDPSVVLWHGTYYLVYCTQREVRVRTSTDLQQWGQPHTILRMNRNTDPESPTIVHHADSFYLFVCGWNGVWDGKTVDGAYQHQTYVYASDDPLRFDAGSEIAILESHASEVFQGEDGQWYSSSAEWPQRGVSIARLVWE
jgi:beta-fructofuranosidase